MSPFLQTESIEQYGKLSPDGLRLAYESGETGIPEVYVQSFPGKEGKWQISTRGGRRPRWSRDGRELFYLSADDKLVAVDVKSGTKFEHGVRKPLFGIRVGAESTFDVSPDGKRFLMVSAREQTSVAPMTVIVNWNAGWKK